MLKKMTAIGMALGLILPGYAVLAQTTQTQSEVKERTEKQEMLQKGSPAAGEQVRTQERERTREETQKREADGKSKQQKQQKKQTKKSGKDATLSGDQLRDRDRDKDRDRDRLHEGSGTQTRKGGK